MMAPASSFNFRRFVLYILGTLLIITILLKNVSLSVVLENNNFMTTPSPKNLSLISSYPILNIWQIYKPGFEYPNTQLCPNNGENVKLIILITSPPNGHEERRQNIRNTWGHFALRKDIVIAFVIGQPKNEQYLSRRQIQKEMETYDDIIIENNLDSYDNLTLKTLSMLEWTVTYCNQSKYLLKTDDDMWINVPKMLKLTDSLNETNKREIYGSLRKNEKPIRSANSVYAKYIVPFDQYSGEYFPTFTPGPAYLLPRQIWKDLYDEALINKYVKLEDVFFTGILAEKLKIERVNVNRFLWFLGGGFNLGRILNYSAVSLSNSKDLYSIWSELNIRDGKGSSGTNAYRVGWTYTCIIVLISLIVV